MRRPNPPMSCRSDIVGGGGGRREVLVLMRADVTRCQLPRSRGFTAPLTRRGQFTAAITISLRALALCLGAQCHSSFGERVRVTRVERCIERCITFRSWVSAQVRQQSVHAERPGARARNMQGILCQTVVRSTPDETTGASSSLESNVCYPKCTDPLTLRVHLSDCHSMQRHAKYASSSFRAAFFAPDLYDQSMKVVRHSSAECSKAAV